MRTETDPFRQGFDTAARHIELLRQQPDLPSGKQGGSNPALEELGKALVALNEAHSDLLRQHQACAARCRDLETECRQGDEERERLLAQITQDRRHAEELAATLRRELESLEAVMDSSRAQAQRQADEMAAVLNAIPDPVAVWDTQGAVVRANPAAVTLGIGPERAGSVELAARLDVRHPDGRPVSAEELPVARALRGEIVLGEVELLVNAAGEEQEILVSVAPVVTDGLISGAVVASHDITDLRRAEEALRQANERIEFTLAASGAGSWDWELASGKLEWSSKMFDLLGMDAGTTTATFDAWRSALHPNDREEAERRIEVALETHSELRSEYRINLPDGRVRWISALGRGFYDHLGQPTRMSGLFLDVTERKAAEAKVEHLSSFPQLNPNPVLEVDASGTIVFHNAGTTAVIERLELRDGPRAFLPDDLEVILHALNRNKDSTFKREVRVGSATFSETIQTIPAFNVARIYAFEITERKEAEEALRQAQLQTESDKRHLEAVLEALPVGVSITDAQGGIVLTNGMYEQIWGPRPVTHDVSDYVHYKAWWADSGKPVEPHEWASAQSVLEGKPVFGQVLELQRFDGGRRFVVNSAVPIRDEDGRVVGSAVAVQDITELRRAELALRESEARFRTVIENSRDGINMLDLETRRYVFMSPAQAKLTGFSAGELRDLPAEEALARVHPNDREKSLSQQNEISEGHNQGSTIEYRWRVKSGEYRWFSDSRTLVRDEQGRAVALVGVSRDITDRKRAEEALRESEEKYRLLFQNMAEGFALYELLNDEQSQPADWRILEVNDAYGRHTGLAREQIVGRCASELFPASIPEYLPRFAAVVATQTPSDIETFARAVGRHQHVVTFPAGGRRFANIIEDISDRKAAEAELMLASRERARLEERQRLARELHDSVSQALYAISLGAHTALTQLDTDRSAVHEALTYVISLAQAGMDEMRAVIFDLRPESLEREGLVVALKRQAAALRAGHEVMIELSLSDEPAAPLPVKEALYRISQEALQNAVKHARADRLEVHLIQEPDAIRLDVSDNGVGFDPQAPHLGHLGLHSMRERATEIGGTLEITSAHGCGTHLCALVPIAPMAPSESDS